MTAFHKRALVSLLFALLIAMLIAVAEGGGVARADTPADQTDQQSAAAPALNNGREAGDSREEEQDRSNVEEYFEWGNGWDHSFRRHARRGEGRKHGDDVVNFGHDADLPAGAQADSVVSILGSASSEGDTGDLVAILGDTKSSGHVKDSAVAVLGNVRIDGTVGGDVVAVLGSVDLGPHAEIGGDVTAVGGAVTRDPAAIVHGDVQSIGGFKGGFGRFRPWIDHCLLYGRPLALVPGIGWAWGLALFFLALYVCLALVFRDAVIRCVDTVEREPGMTLVAALLSILLIPIAIVLLCITLIGIAAIPFVVFGLFCAGVFGKAVMLAWIGRLVVRRREPLTHPAIAVLIGGLIVLVLYLVPVLGFLVYKILGLFGLGAVVYTLILAGRARRAAQSAGTAPGPTPPGAAAAQGGGTTATVAPGAGAGSASPPHGIDPALGPALPRAGFWIRMAALLLDLLLVGIVTGMLHHSSDLELVVLATYGALMWKLRGSTVGGIVFHLQVIRLDGRPIDWETAIVRALACFLSMVVAGLGFFWIAFDPGKQAWHDKIAGTAVVRVPRAVPLV